MADSFGKRADVFEIDWTTVDGGSKVDYGKLNICTHLPLAELLPKVVEKLKQDHDDKEIIIEHIQAKRANPIILLGIKET